MKKLFCFLFVIPFAFLLVHSANATLVVFEFDPDDLIGLYSTTPLPVSTVGSGSSQSHLKYEQTSPRRVHETWAGTMYNTFGTTDFGGTETDLQSQNAYIAWRNSLDQSNEGIFSFNIWLRDNTNAWNWGERLVSNPNYLPTATAASGWTVSVIANPWGSGWLVQWETTQSDNLINLANDLDTFSFTVDVREISASGQTFDSGGVDIALGTDWDIWFGSYLGICNNDSFYADWEGYEGSLELTATPVPIPSAFLLFASGILGVHLLRKRRK